MMLQSSNSYTTPIQRLILFVVITTTTIVLLSSISIVQAIKPPDEGCYDVPITYEDFEGPYDGDSWINGATEYDEEFSSFLGRLGEGREYTSKSFDIPISATSATMSFLFYEIDLWCHCDELDVIICGEEVYLDTFDQGNRKRKRGRKNDIIWKSTAVTTSQRVAYNARYKDQIHLIQMILPQRCWTEVTPGRLDVTFNLTIHGYVYFILFNFSVIITCLYCTHCFGILLFSNQFLFLLMRTTHHFIYYAIPKLPCGTSVILI